MKADIANHSSKFSAMLQCKITLYISAGYDMRRRGAAGDDPKLAATGRATQA